MHKHEVCFGVNSLTNRFSPEVIQSQPYGEKADVWASGCILYQMATLKPPFYSSNMLALATKVCQGLYDFCHPAHAFILENICSSLLLQLWTNLSERNLKCGYYLLLVAQGRAFIGERAILSSFFFLTKTCDNEQQKMYNVRNQNSGENGS